MKEIISLIKLECAGDVIIKKNKTFTITELVQKGKKMCIWPICGVIEPHMCALISKSFTHQCIEITRIEVEKKYRKRGIMTDFIRRMAAVSSECGLVLVMGCVSSDVMCTIMEHNKDKWKKCSWDPTSYMYINNS
jgi:hypothetical protein